MTDVFYLKKVTNMIYRNLKIIIILTNICMFYAKMCLVLNKLVLAQIYATCIKQPSLHTYFYSSSVCLYEIKSCWIKLEVDSRHKESLARYTC